MNTAAGCSGVKGRQGRKSGPNVRRTMNHDRVCWVVDIPKNEAGKRSRRFRATREEALRLARECQERVRRLGTEWTMRFDRLTPFQKAELVYVHEEAQRMAWADVRDDGFEILAHKAKTRARRWAPMTPQLLVWLEAARNVSAGLPSVNRLKRWDAARRAAGLFVGWPRNAPRHSFASFHLAAFRNETEAASILGNSPAMIHAHYRALVRPAAAEAFFALRPDPAALAEEVRREAVPRIQCATLDRNRGRNHGRKVT